MPSSRLDRSRNQLRAIEIQDVTKSYGRLRVLDRLSLELDWGEVLSVLGPNGSGKTTLLRILATLTKADSGSVRLAGMDPERSGPLVRRAIGVVMHDPMLYADLTARENLRFICKMFGLNDTEERITEVAYRVGMVTGLDRRIGTLSHGMQKRFSIARALLHHPRVLLMDEPESGLDQSAIALMSEIVEATKLSGGAVLLVTHNLDQALALGDRLAILVRGSLAHEQRLDVPGQTDVDSLREVYFRYATEGRANDPQLNQSGSPL